MTWSADVVWDTLSSGNVQRHSSVMKNYADLKQYIHLDNPYNLQKLCETLRPLQPMPNLPTKEPHTLEGQTGPYKETSTQEM